MRQLARTALAGSGLAALGRRSRRGDACILTYHNIIPDDAAPEGDHSLHLSRSALAVQLDQLAGTHDVVPLPALLEDPERDARPRAVITFDDSYRGAVRIGLPEIVARGLPATIFVAPAYLGRSGFWWDALAGKAPLAADVRRRALEELGGDEERIRAWAEREGWTITAPGIYGGPASEEELREAASASRISIGSHSWSHPNLVRQSDETLRRELRSSLEWLAKRFPSFTPWLSYPYGLWTPRVEGFARDAGYTAAVRTRGGWVGRRGPRPFTFPRVDVPRALSPAGFTLRTAGFFCPT